MDVWSRNNTGYRRNDKINPDLWRRFLIKNNYCGIYKRHGVDVYAIATDCGVLELIKSSIMKKSARMYLKDKESI